MKASSGLWWLTWLLSTWVIGIIIQTFRHLSPVRGPSLRATGAEQLGEPPRLLSQLDAPLPAVQIRRWSHSEDKMLASANSLCQWRSQDRTRGGGGAVCLLGLPLSMNECLVNVEQMKFS